MTLRLLLEPVVRTALLEDLGRAGDITSEAIVPAGAQVEAAIVARGAGVVAGLDAASLAFQLVDPAVAIERLCADGTEIGRGAAVATVRGSARAVLAA
jgi:nicotinate-nucleotide pyrophosphorylase (carboxylating)